MSIPAIRRLAAVVAGTFLALGIAPSAFACQGDFAAMSFATAVRPAQFIVVATVTAGPIAGEPGTWLLRVDRVLRGRAPSRLVIPHPFSGDLCEVNLVRATRVVLAMTDPASVAYGETFAWLVEEGGELIDLNLPGMVTDNPPTLDDLAARVGELPPTDTPTRPQVSFLAFLLVVGPALFAALLSARRVGLRRITAAD